MWFYKYIESVNLLKSVNCAYCILREEKAAAETNHTEEFYKYLAGLVENINAESFIVDKESFLNSVKLVSFYTKHQLLLSKYSYEWDRSLCDIFESYVINIISCTSP